ncbi:MAG: aldo/keto reductase [Pseudoprimorskyibacter sp.]|nr:aldo/keto reductase [Pseudoprimorskyibacter sp.]
MGLGPYLEAVMSIYYQKSFQRSFGTFPLNGDALLGAIDAAVQVGFRAFDTAQMYGNEAATGEALAASGIGRQDLCITTKVMAENFSDARFLVSVEQSLKDLRMDHVDVLLVHWPPADGDITPSLQQLQKAQERGLTRHIGVSNYTVTMMQKAVQVLDVPIVTNQVEFHPLLDQTVLMKGANALGIPLSAYCAIARGEVFRRPLLSEIGLEYGKSAAQIALRWTLQKGVSVNVMSTRPANIAANFDIMDFTLSNVDMARIDELTRENHRIVNKSLAPFAPDFD